MTTLFLFAHQDDEVGALHVVADSKRRGSNVMCAFLTNGAWAGVTSETRNAESRKALSAIGVGSQEINFVGTGLGVPDGALVEHLEHSFSSLCEIVERLSADGTPVTRIIMHAWEGGHQDHDSVHILGVALARRYDLLDASRQFPLYRRSDNRVSLGFASPLASNGPVELMLIPWAQRLKYLAILTSYKSQLRVIVKLLPHIMRDYATSGTQRLQRLSVSRLAQDPNVPPMLYETWNLYTYQRFRDAAQPFIDRHITNTAPHSGSTGASS